jgi:protein TonB
VAAARFGISFLLASGVTFGLFYLMQSLIGVEGTLNTDSKIKVVDFVHVERTEDVKEKERKLPEKKKIDDTPPPPDMDFDANPDMTGDGISIGAAVEGSIGLDSGGGFSMASADGDAVPMVRVPPQYPEKAMQRGIEGRVLVQFTISKIGTVKDAIVIASEPSSIFNKAALKSVSQWKYNPRIENGQAVEQKGIRTSVVFKLGSEKS